MTSIERTQKSHDAYYDVKMNKVMPEIIQRHTHDVKPSRLEAMRADFQKRLLQRHTHDVKPSRLESMRADFQKRLLKEKEEKLIQIYEDNRKKAMARLTKNEPENIQNDVYNVKDRKSVRDFFNERRRMEANGAPMPHIQNHYKLATSKKSSGSNLEDRKISFGGQRLQPLAPIQRHEQAEATTINIRPEIQQKARAVDAGNKDYNALNGRAPLTVLKSIPSSNRHFGDTENSHGSADTNIKTPRANFEVLQKKLPPTKLQLQSSLQPQSAINNSRPQPPNEAIQAEAEDTLTEFQKWRMSHLKTGDERYKKINTNKSENSNEGPKTQIDGSTVDYYTNNSNNHEIRSDNNNKADPGTRKKTNDREYGDNISGQQKGLDTVRKTKETEEETNEMGEQQRQKLGVERGRENNQEHVRKDTKYRKQRENKIVLKRFDEESQENENDGQRNETEKNAKEDKSRRSKLTKTKSRDKATLPKQPDSLASHAKDYIDNKQAFDQDQSLSTKQTSHFSPNSNFRSQPSVSKALVAQPEVSKVYEDTNYRNEAEPIISDLAQCPLCGRSFLPERLKKHQDACAKANKPRKEFDSSKKRVEGTEQAKYASKTARADPPKKKSNWRSKHEEFIQSLHYARKVTQHEKDGLDPRQLTPPKATKNPDYVPCPHCGRTFNVTAAERHIPRCQALKTRPPPMSTKHK